MFPERSHLGVGNPFSNRRFRTPFGLFEGSRDSDDPPSPPPLERFRGRNIGEYTCSAKPTNSSSSPG